MLLQTNIYFLEEKAISIRNFGFFAYFKLFFCPSCYQEIQPLIRIYTSICKCLSGVEVGPDAAGEPAFCHLHGDVPEHS
jgi:hypothetical protein